MLKSNELERVSMAFDELMRSLEMQVMQDIVRRIKINGEITRAADWQIYRLHELGMSKRDIKKAVADNLNLSKADIKHLYKDIIRKGYSHDESLYKYKGKPQIPFNENESLQQLISATSEQTSGEIHNISQSLGFAVRHPDGSLKFTEIGEYYQSTLDNAVLGIASGVFDYNTVIKRVISEMTNSGLRTVDYSTGWSNRVDVAARRAVMTGLSQLTARVNEDNATQLGTDYFEVTWHSGARPSHQVWQGRVYSRAELETVCGLGTVTGLCGANCYHDYYPFVPDISERTYTDEQLDEMNAEENKKVKYNGKEYTKYEALQRQRRLETTMRAQRQKIKLLEEAEANEDDIINARCRYRGTSQEYTRFSREMGLPQQRERVTADGLGNIGVGKYKASSDKAAYAKTKSVKSKLYEPEKIPNNSLTFSTESDIIKTEEKFQPLLDEAFSHSSSIEQLKAAWEPFVSQNVTDAEWQGINGGYVRTPNSFRINEKLRNNPGAKIEDLFKDPFDLRTVRDLDSAINKNTLNQNVLLTRNVGLDYLMSTLNLSPNDIQNIYQSIKDESSYKAALKWLNDRFKNKKVIEDAFLSTSGNSSLNVFSDKPVRLEIKVPKGTKALVTKNFMESEVILGRGTKYTIESVERFAIDKSNFGLKFIVRVV